MTEDYVRKARVSRVIDGDTIVADIDLGFKIWRFDQRIRLLGCNCPEVSGQTKDAGSVAMQATFEWLAAAKWGAITIQTFVKDTDSFGRVLAKVWRTGDAVDLSSFLIANGHAVPFMG